MINTYPEQMRRITRPVILLIMLMTMNSGILAKELAGKTIITKGLVQATDNEPGLQRILKRRSPVYGTDLVTTDADSKAQLRMTDGGMIALKENSELLITNYQFIAEDDSGSVVLELIKGGLRSVTGAIKSNKGDYKLKTPVGTIGIRGTHYEIELIQGQVFIAVWDGAVDISVDVGGSGKNVSLGDGEDYAYAKIDDSGEVTELLAPPENFSQGHSSDPEEEQTKEDSEGEGSEQEGEQTSEEEQAEGSDQKGEQSSEEEQAEGAEQLTEETEDETLVLQEDGSPSTSDEEPQQAEEVVLVEEPFAEETDFIAQDIVEEELALTPAQELTDLIAARTGVFVYDQVSNLVFDTQTGTNFAASMSINFDTSEISNGSLSFDDSGGEEWFAAFNGSINGASLVLGVNFASHGNKLAAGNIDSVFTEGIDGLFNVFELFEVDNTEIRTQGRFNLSN